MNSLIIAISCVFLIISTALAVKPYIDLKQQREININQPFSFMFHIEDAPSIMEIYEGKFKLYFYSPEEDHNIDLKMHDFRLAPVESVGYKVKIRSKVKQLQSYVGERVRVCIKDSKKRFFATLACSDYLDIVNDDDQMFESSESSENPFA